jgi:hypothetical protein
LNLEVRKKGAVTGNPLPLRGTDNGDGTGSLDMVVTGSSVAHDAPDSENPVKVGFRAESTTPAAVADNDRSDLRGTLYGAAFANLRRATDGVEIAARATSADGVAATEVALWSGAVLHGYNGVTVDRARVGSQGDAFNGAGMLAQHPHEYNGATFDRRRNNSEGTLLASAARTATTAFANQVNYNAQGVKIIVRVSAIGTGNLTPALRGIDPVSGVEYNLLGTVTAITAAGTYVYEVMPGASGTTSEIPLKSSSGLPRTWGGRITSSDGSSWTYSVGYQYTV